MKNEQIFGEGKTNFGLCACCKIELEEIYQACNTERVFEIQKRIGDLLRRMSKVKE